MAPTDMHDMSQCRDGDDVERREEDETAQDGEGAEDEEHANLEN